MSEAQDLTPAVQEAAIEKQQGGPPVRHEYTSEEIALISTHFCSGAPENEMGLYFAIARHANLDPFLGEIYLIKFWNATKKDYDYTPIVGIDGMRKRAAQSPDYGGVGLPEWCDESKTWHEIWLSESPPIACRVPVYIKGEPRATYGMVHYREYVRTKKDGGVTAFWKNMFCNQMAKCAEAQGLRKAFPAQAQGLYIAEEFGQTVSEATMEEIRTAAGEKPAAEKLPVEAPKQPDFDTDHKCPLKGCKGKLYVTVGKYGPCYKCRACGKFMKKKDWRDAKYPDPVTLEPPSETGEVGKKDIARAIVKATKALTEEQLGVVVEVHGLAGESLSTVIDAMSIEDATALLKDLEEAAIEDAQFEDNNGGEPE